MNPIAKKIAVILLIVAVLGYTILNYYSGKKLVLINRDPTPYDGKADLVIHGSLGQVFGRVV